MDAELQNRLLVADPQIDEVLDLVTGKVAPAESFVTGDYKQVLQYRLHLIQEMRAGRARHACPICAVPVHLVRREKERRFHFRHETEDGRCPVKTKGKFSGEQILAMKYDGARESQAHRDMKELIAASLRCDPDFSDVEVEPIWKGIEKNSRRRPNVRALWKGRLPVAFEVQLSATFLRVIAERREFYMRNGGLLLWVFKDFELGDARLMQDDIFYNNNRNAFVASPATLEASRERDKLALDCVWSEPVLEEGLLAWRQDRRLASFDELVVDAQRHRVFLFDAEAARAKFESEYAGAKLRADFRRYWLRNHREFDELSWNDLRERLGDRGVELPSHPGNGRGLYSLLDTLYSVAEGKPVGWGHSNLVKIAHHIFERHPGHLWVLKLMLAAHERGDQIRAEDASRKWRTNKVPAYREAWAAGDEKFDHDPTWDDLVEVLFPEIAKDLRTTPH